MPLEIISDWVPKFISQFRTTLFKICGTKIKLSITYHLEIDGQTKWIEPLRTCFDYMFIRDNNLGTSDYIFVIVYNQRLHSSDCSPFFALYGQDYKTPITILTPSTRYIHWELSSSKELYLSAMSCLLQFINFSWSQFQHKDLLKGGVYLSWSNLTQCKDLRSGVVWLPCTTPSWVV